jgi:hypothetical protein
VEYRREGGTRYGRGGGEGVYQRGDVVLGEPGGRIGDGVLVGGSVWGP